MYQEKSLHYNTISLGTSQLHLFGKSEKKHQDVKSLVGKLYTNLIKIKKIVEKKGYTNSFNIIRFVNFLILSRITANNIIHLSPELQLFILDIFKLEKKTKNLSEQRITELAALFNIRISEDDKRKIVHLLDKMALDKIPYQNQELVIKVFGQVYEKVVTKKEIGAYYTTEETTKYITTNSIIPNIITNWSKLNKSLNEHLNFYYKKNHIPLIENAIKNNQNLEVTFFDLLNQFGTKDLEKIIKNISIIDISCGSGSFIFYAYFLLKKFIIQ